MKENCDVVDLMHFNRDEFVDEEKEIEFGSAWQVRNVLRLSSTDKRNRHVIINDPEIWSLVDPGEIIREIVVDDEEKGKEIVERIHRVPRVNHLKVSLLSTKLPTSHSLAFDFGDSQPPKKNSSSRSKKKKQKHV